MRGFAHFIAFIAFAAAFTAAPPSGHAADAGQTMLVIDGSGSMWGKFDRDTRAKIDIVRELMQSKISAASTRKIGMISFGHRRKADCSDVEVLVPAASDHTPLSEALAKLNPRGKGPLAAAIREAAAALGSERPANVIVINDGIDNCRQDACAVGADVARTAPGVAIHVVALAVEPAEQPQLSCLSQATGGTFHDVKTAEQLAAALDEVAAVAMQVPRVGDVADRPPSSAQTSPTETGLHVRVALSPDGPPINLPITWSIYQPGGTAKLAESTGATLTARLDAGSYDIEAAYGRLKVKQPVDVPAGKTTTVTVALNAGRLNVSAKGGNELQPAPATAILIAIEPEVDGKPQPDATILVHKKALTEVLPAGNYTVRLSDGPVQQTKVVKLAAGADLAIDFTTSTGRLELSASRRDDGGALDDVTFSISEDDPDSPDGRREVARSRAPAPSFTLPAGTYYASAKSGDGEVRQRIAVGAGDVVKRALTLPLVPIKINASIVGGKPLNNLGITYRVVALDGDRKEIVRSVKPELTANVLPGRYRISAHIDSHHLKVAKEVTIEPGQSQDINLQFAAGEIQLTAPVGATADAAWEIFDANGKRCWRAVGVPATALLPPGRYTVHLQRRDQNLQAAFEVVNGEQKVVQIGQN